MNRTVLAFAVAPLWVTFATATLDVFIFPYSIRDPWILLMIIIGTVLGYAGTLLLGVPLFLLLRARGQTSIWVALILGFVIASLTWTGFLILFPLSLGSSPSFDVGLVDLIWLLATGALGSIVGATIWLLARPDRFAASHSRNPAT